MEQAGPEELRVTTVKDKQEFLIKAEALTHEQYELFAPMALTRYSKNHDFLINLFLPGGIRLQARGSSKELAKPISGQGPPPFTPLVKIPVQQSEAKPPVDTPKVASITPDPKSPALPKSSPIPGSPSSLPGIPGKTFGMIYQSPARDQPGLRIDGTSSDSQFPSIFVLAPNHVGHTSQEHPVLFWFLSQETHDPLDIMIAKEGNLEALLDIRLLPPLQAGIHELRLGDYGIGLRPDVVYRWTVKMITVPPSKGLTASGAIKRNTVPVGSSKSLVYSPENYAQKGQWYDALTALANLIQSKPGNTLLLAQRAALLKQVGLSEAAAFVQ